MPAKRERPANWHAYHDTIHRGTLAGGEGRVIGVDCLVGPDGFDFGWAIDLVVDLDLVRMDARGHVEAGALRVCKDLSEFLNVAELSN